MNKIRIVLILGIIIGIIIFILGTFMSITHEKIYLDNNINRIYWDEVTLSNYLAERQGFDIQSSGNGAVVSYDGYSIKCRNKLLEGTSSECCVEINGSFIVKQSPDNCMINFEDEFQK